MEIMSEILLWCVYWLVVCGVMLQGLTVWFLVVFDKPAG